MFKKILALHTGGTISMAADDSGAVITNEVNPMTQIASPIEGIEVVSEDIFNLPSPQMTPRHMLALYQKIKEEAQNEVMNDLRGHFRPEFLNRLDEIIMFKPLTKDNIGSIVDLMVKELNDRLADQELSLELTEAAKKDVIDNGYDPVYGARPLKRYLQKYVETLTARKILSGEVHTGDTLLLDVENGEYVVRVK